MATTTEPDPRTEPPRRPIGCNCFAIRSAARQVSQFYDQHLAPSGLRTTQYSVLSRLSRAGPLAIGELARDLDMDRTTMGRALGPLEREGLVDIGKGRDGRTRALSLTIAGRERLDFARPLWREAQERFETGFGAPEAEALRAALARAKAFAAAAATPVSA